MADKNIGEECFMSMSQDLSSIAKFVMSYNAASYTGRNAKLYDVVLDGWLAEALESDPKGWKYDLFKVVRDCYSAEKAGKAVKAKDKEGVWEDTDEYWPDFTVWSACPADFGPLVKELKAYVVRRAQVEAAR